MHNTTTETKLFGVPKDTPIAQETKNETTAPVEQEPATEPQKETDVEPSEPKPKVDEKPADKPEGKEVEDNVSPAKESPKETKPALKVDFGGSKEKQNEVPEKKEEALPVTESAVLEYLNKNGIKAERLSDLSQKVTLNEEVEKFKKFNEETGLGAKEFYNLNRDWNKEPTESRISEYLKLKNPNISDDEIQLQLEFLTVTEDDEQELSERDLKKKKLEFSKINREAMNFLTEKQKEYSVPKKADQPKAELTEQDIAEQYRPYWNSRDKSLKEFNEIKFNIEGIGEINIPVEEDFKKLISESTETEKSLTNRWIEGGKLNTNQLVEDNAWGIKSIREKLIQSIVEQTHAKTLENFSKENRNVDLDKPPRQTEKMSKEGLIIERPEHRKKEKFGSPLI